MSPGTYRLDSLLRTAVIGLIAEASVCAMPAKILDLSAWRETLPVAADGSAGADKIAASIDQPKLAGFQARPWFHDTLGAEGPAVAFRANAGGARTSTHTLFARSELREMTASPYDEAAWAFKDGKQHTLTITQAITALPVVHPHTAAGQIHDADNDVFMLKCEGKTPGKVSTGASLVGYTDNSDKSFLIDGNYLLGTYFTLTVTVTTGGSLTVLYNGKATPIAAYTSFPVIKKLNPDLNGMYFKAGCYIQTNPTKYGEDPDAFAEVHLAKLQVVHGVPTALADPGISATGRATGFASGSVSASSSGFGFRFAHWSGDPLGRFGR
jgi:hypothetical protein